MRVVVCWAIADAQQQTDNAESVSNGKRRKEINKNTYMPRRNKKKAIDKRLNAIKCMPPLYHTLPGQEFDREKSEALHWVSSNLLLVDYLFQRCCQRGLIRYNPRTGKWQGVDYEPEFD